MSVRLRTKWLWVRIRLRSLKIPRRFSRSSVSLNFRNVLFSCSRTSSNLWIILEQASLPVVMMLTGELSKGFDLYDFNAPFRAKTNPCFFLHYLPTPYGWKLFYIYFVTHCHCDTAQKMEISIKNFFSKCEKKFPVDLVTFTE